jgi:hypothetical protein
MTRRFDILLPDSAPVHDPWCWRDDWHAPGESAFSLLAKFQRLNALSCAALIESFACHYGRRRPPQELDLRDARRFDLLHMRDLLRLSLTSIAEAFVMPSSAIQQISYPMLRWCARCAQEGVHLTVFQDRRVDRCPVHRIPLTERCERCDEPIAYRLRSDLFKAPFNCPSCGHPWWVPNQGIDDLRVAHTYRRRLGKGEGRDRPTAKASNSAADIRYATSGLSPTRNEPNPVSEYQLPMGRALWITYGKGVQDDADDPWSDDAMERGFVDDRDAQARACYKAVRRWIMRAYSRPHLSCIETAAGHLAWPLGGSTTTAFCPVAMAFLRWRCKWEGVGTPRSLLQQPVHGLLGLAVWLSLHAPDRPHGWTSEAGHWLTLHALTAACMDSFATYLAEAQGAGANRRVLWLPFPVEDFPRRAIVTRGGASPDDVVRLCILPFDTRYGDRPLRPQHGTAKHRREHLDCLNRNISPDDQVFLARVR